MYSLFTNPPRMYTVPMVVPRFADVEKRILSDVDRVVNYHRYGSFFVKSSHLLCRVISQMGIPLNYELDRYYEIAKARAGQISFLSRMSSSVNPGKWFSGVFYFGCNEIILSVDTEERPSELVKDWRNLKPVRVLQHPVSNLNYMLPTGREHNIERGLVVVSVNIPILMVMYRCFMITQKRLKETSEGALTTPQAFVAKYVIPNMLYSQTDLVLLNRLINLFRGAPMGDSILHHSFYTSDYSELLDKGLMEVLKRISTVRMSYRDMLGNIPKLYNDFPLMMPDMAETHQVWWSLFLTRLKEISFLFDAAGEEGRHVNRGLLNNLKIDIKGFRSENIFKRALLPDMYIDTHHELDRIFKLL